MPSQVHLHRGYRIAVYTLSDHLAVITRPDSNAVIDLKERQPRSTLIEGPKFCLEQAIALIDSLATNSIHPDGSGRPPPSPS